jgi:hypothetical protein
VKKQAFASRQQAPQMRKVDQDMSSNAHHKSTSCSAAVSGAVTAMLKHWRTREQVACA